MKRTIVPKLLPQTSRGKVRIFWWLISAFPLWTVWGRWTQRNALGENKWILPVPPKKNKRRTIALRCNHQGTDKHLCRSLIWVKYFSWKPVPFPKFSCGLPTKAFSALDFCLIKLLRKFIPHPIKKKNYKSTHKSYTDSLRQRAMK